MTVDAGYTWSESIDDERTRVRQMTNWSLQNHKGRVAVIGASGFIGQHVFQALLHQGLLPVAVPRSALAPNLPDLADAVSGAEIVVNFAAAGVSPKAATPDELRRVNVELPVRITEAMAASGSSSLVMAGTAAEYGASGDRYERIPPDAPLHPLSDYARSKADGFVELTAAAFRFGLHVEYIRIFNAFGPGQAVPALWPALEQAARSGRDFRLSSGRTVRDFIPIESVANSFARVALALSTTCTRAANHGTVTVRNLGTGHGLTVREFATTWWERWGGEGRLIFGALDDRAVDPRQLVAEVSRVHRITDGG
jgi:nucleoside-diphosphate-sugar epimerase